MKARLKETRGVSTVEYGLIAALLGLGVVAGLSFLGGQTRDLFGSTAGVVSGEQEPLAPGGSVLDGASVTRQKVTVIDGSAGKDTSFEGRGFAGDKMEGHKQDDGPIGE